MAWPLDVHEEENKVSRIGVWPCAMITDIVKRDMPEASSCSRMFIAKWLTAETAGAAAPCWVYLEIFWSF